MPDLKNRAEYEKRISTALVLLFGEWERKSRESAAQAWNALADGVRAAVADVLAEVYRESFLNMASAAGLSIDLDNIEDETRRKAEAFGLTLGVEIADQTRDRVEELHYQLSAGEISREQFSAGLATVFGQARVEQIAITEVTRGISVGEAAALLLITQETGQELVPVWYTERDGRVCPICAPLHGRRKEYWQGQFPGGPPAHPRCRCWLTYEVA